MMRPASSRAVFRSQRDTKLSELETLGERVEVELRQALAKKPRLESRQRIARLLARLEEPVSAPETLQVLRAVEVLEYIGTADAIGVLEVLAHGAPEGRLTREAKASLERLSKRTAVPH